MKKILYSGIALIVLPVIILYFATEPLWLQLSCCVMISIGLVMILNYAIFNRDIEVKL
jgi:hypothetical protein